MPTSTKRRSEARVALPVDDLARVVLRALQPGNGRGPRCEIKQELPQRFADAGVVVDSGQLAEALVRLEDSGCIVRGEKHFTQYAVHVGMKQFDAVDRLCADVARVMKVHGDEFSSEAELQGWLTDNRYEWDEDTLDKALSELEGVGRLRRPRQDHWDESRALAGYWVGPKIYSE
jgi:hypothetical protein